MISLTLQKNDFSTPKHGGLGRDIVDNGRTSMLLGIKTLNLTLQSNPFEDTISRH